ncbi:MBL fold metallo-hydrolase [Tunturiibacter empetritectus]|uniref:MBL fold metallo-hydrolase n=1 Tax=Tunturiibacter empetritectus TaxID=3069691 RepID=UPI003D9B5661
MAPCQRLPDLRQQLINNPEIHPDPAKGLRNTPVVGIILTSADLDHILGLLLLREFTPVRIYATRPVISILKKTASSRCSIASPDKAAGQRSSPT